MPMYSVTIVSALSKKKIDNAEGAPEFAEALEDEPGMAHASNCSETQHHLLIDIENGDQQH